MSQRSLHQAFGGDNKSFTVPPFRTRFLFIPALGIPIRANARCVAITNNNNNIKKDDKYNNTANSIIYILYNISYSRTITSSRKWFDVYK